MNSEIAADALTRPSQASSSVPSASVHRSVVNPVMAKQKVLNAVHELYSQGLPVTREALLRVCECKVDDAIKALREQGLIWAPERGVYRPIEIYPPARPISKTILSTGVVKIEIGDEVITLTPEENRRLAELQAGAAAQVAALEGANAMLELAHQANRLIQGEVVRQRRGQSAKVEEESL